MVGLTHSLARSLTHSLDGPGVVSADLPERLHTQGKEEDLLNGFAITLREQQGRRPDLPSGASTLAPMPGQQERSNTSFDSGVPQDFATHAAKLDTNEQLRLASTFSGLALIMKQLSPVRGSSQMNELETDSFVLQSFDTLTGLKFFLTADPDSRHLDAVLKEVYVYYSDYVLKNPFYELDMPIQCERFEEKVIKLASDYNRSR